MADYSTQISDLQAAHDICEKHTITTQINGVETSYPRWPEAWSACEVVWRAYLDMKTMDGSYDDDRLAVIREARRLKGL